MRLRIATAGDAAGIAAVHVASWQAAYRGLVPEQALDDLDASRLTVRWAGLLGEDESSTTVLDAEHGILGFCRVTWRDPGEGTGEIAALYLHPDAWGRHLGRLLCERALAQLAKHGCSEVILWALAGNLRAEHFYAAAGFRPDGAAKTHPRLGLPMVRYRIALGPAPAPGNSASTPG